MLRQQALYRRLSWDWSYSFDFLEAVGALRLIVIEHPPLQAVFMKDVWVEALQLHDELLVAEALHADAAIESLLEDKRAKCYFFELFERVWSIYAGAIYATYVTQGNKWEKYEDCEDSEC